MDKVAGAAVKKYFPYRVPVKRRILAGIVKKQFGIFELIRTNFQHSKKNPSTRKKVSSPLGQCHYTRIKSIRGTERKKKRELFAAAAFGKESSIDRKFING